MKADAARKKKASKLKKAKRKYRSLEDTPEGELAEEEELDDDAPDQYQEPDSSEKKPTSS